MPAARNTFLCVAPYFGPTASAPWDIAGKPHAARTAGIKGETGKPFYQKPLVYAEPASPAFLFCVEIQFVLVPCCYFQNRPPWPTGLQRK